MIKQITIGSRGSTLALIQSKEIKSLLQTVHPHIDIRIQIIKTRGDKILDSSLHEISGKGQFTAELEEGLLSHQIDLAVHSLKDLPSTLDKGLKYTGSPTREDVRDAFISTKWNSIKDIPKGGIIATGSVRRKSQLLTVRPDLEIHNLRGNINTRLEKLDKNKWDGILVAASAMHRLNLRNSITQYLDIRNHVPAACQGALGIEIAEDRQDMEILLQSIIDMDTTLCCLAERAFLQTLMGGCSVPIGCYAGLKEDKFSISGYLSDENGLNKISKTKKGARKQAEILARQLGEEMMQLHSNQISTS